MHGHSKFLLFQENLVLQARSRKHYWSGEGPLSIKTFRHGRAFYKTKLGHYAVESGGYLLLNQGDPYTISIESETEVEAFCIFFKRGFADHYIHELRSRVANVLDDPFADARQQIDFHTTTYPYHHLLLPVLERFKQSLPVLGSSQLWMDEQYQLIMWALAHVHLKITADIHTLPFVRAATREELYRRLALAYEYINAYYNKNVSLADIAKIACISPNHLIRNFRYLFKKTPHQLMIEKRICEAKRLLLETEHSVANIALSVGYADISSFNKIFKQHTGMSPQAFRKR